jgi:hypothetical protein
VYDSGKIIWTGGGNEPSWDSEGVVQHQDDPTQYMGPPTNQTEIIDLNQKAPQWRHSTNMLFPRRQHNATTLLDGTVLVTGGTQGGGFNNLDAGMPVHAAELWNPVMGHGRKWRRRAQTDATMASHCCSPTAKCCQQVAARAEELAQIHQSTA